MFKQLLKNLANPAAITGLIGAALTVAAAFGIPVTDTQSHSILVFGGALSLILFTHGLTSALSYLTPQTVVGLVTAIIGMAIAFGVPVTAGQQTQILNLTGLLAGILLVHGAVHTLARDRRTPEVSVPTEDELARITSMNVEFTKLQDSAATPVTFKVGIVKTPTKGGAAA